MLLRDADLNIKEDHLCRWTTFSRKFPPWLKRWKRFNYVSTRTFRNFAKFLESTHICVTIEMKMCLC